MTLPASPWLDARDAATYARVSRGVILRAARARQLEHVRVSGRGQVLTQTAWIDRWLASLTVHVEASR